MRTRANIVACLGVLSLFSGCLGCADAPPGMEEVDSGQVDLCVSPVRDECTCTDGSPGAYFVDCSGAPTGACVCPTEQECVHPGLRCNGTQTCDLDGCSMCDCVVPANGSGRPKALALAPNGDAYVLLRAAPWLVMHDTLGTVTPLTVQGDLSFATDLVATSSALYAVGLAANGDDVVVHRLSLTGALLGTTTWTPTHFASDTLHLAGAVRQGDQVFVVATTDRTIQFVEISATPQAIGAQLVAPLTDDDIHGVSVAVADDELLVGGWAEPFSQSVQPWVALVSLSGEHNGEYQGGTVISSGTGVARVARTSSDQNYYARSYVGSTGFSAERHSSDLSFSLWSEGTTEIGVLVGVEVVGNDVLLIGASGVLRTTVGGAGPGQLPVDGTVVDSAESTGELVLLVATGSSSHSTTRITFEASADSPTGTACEVGAECEGDLCCVGGNPLTGTCGDVSVGCSRGALCILSNECAAGGCMDIGDVRICGTHCGASSDCAAGEFCVASTCDNGSCPTYCMRDCTSGGTAMCDNTHSDLECQTTPNVENVSVSVCR